MKKAPGSTLWWNKIPINKIVKPTDTPWPSASVTPVYSHTRELGCISSSVDKVWTVPWRGRVVAFSYLFLYLLFSPFPSFYAICLVHVKGLCQRELLSPVENTASSRCLLWCTSQLFFRMSYITGLIFHRGFLSSECPSRHLKEGIFKFYALL